MGLESVEIVMAVEEEFGIQIPDERAVELATVGEMLDFVLTALRQRGDVAVGPRCATGGDTDVVARTGCGGGDGVGGAFYEDRYRAGA